MMVADTFGWEGDWWCYKPTGEIHHEKCYFTSIPPGEFKHYAKCRCNESKCPMLTRLKFLDWRLNGI